MADFDGDDRGEVLDIQPEPPHRRVRVLVVCVLIVLAGVLALWGVGGHDSSTPAPTPTPPPTVAPTPSPPRRTDPATSISPRAREQLRANTSWLGARTGYTLFVRTVDAVYRVRPRATAMILTKVPGLRSGGPVSFVPIRHGVLVHPWDAVPGYTVPDDGPARPSTWEGGVVLPGPDPDHVWIQAADGRQRLTLTDAAGHRGTTMMRIPGPYEPLAVSDGQGYAIVSSTGGVYSLRPEGVNRIANGRLLAAGPAGVIVSRCDTHAVCHAVLLDQSFATVRSLPGISLQRQPPSGVISPDGTVAAMVDGYNQRLFLINLDTGRIAARTPLVINGGTGHLVFSPDSRWLFAVDTGGRAHAVDVHTRKVRDLLPGLGGIRQLAVRP